MHVDVETCEDERLQRLLRADPRLQRAHDARMERAKLEVIHQIHDTLEDCVTRAVEQAVQQMVFTAWADEREQMRQYTGARSCGDRYF
jgi:low affinity Fe/Cu permease